MRENTYVIDVNVRDGQHDFLVARMDGFGLTAVRDNYNEFKDIFELRFDVPDKIKDNVMDFLDEYNFKRWCTPNLSG